MTHEQQRIKIAEACGWKAVELWEGKLYGIRPGESLPAHKYVIPNYPADLNAMHSALQMLDDDQWLEFMLHLLDVCGCQPDANKWTCVRVCMSATAAQLAEAYCKSWD